MSMVLSDYCKQVQRFIRDSDQKYVNPADIVLYVNRARREIAGRTQCLRFLTPISGSVITITITNPGSGYTAPVATISPPDQPSGVSPFPGGAQATAIATQAGGQINNIIVTYGGSGYAAPTVTITDPTGKGATAVATVSSVSQTVAYQEVYPFSAIDLSSQPGYDSVIFVRSVSIIYSNYRYSLPMYDFSTYQAQIRQYPQQYLYVPTMGAQFGQGANGSLYLYPIASTAYPLELDCVCLPSDLVNDLDVDPIPMPWQDAVPYMAAHMAYLELQNLNGADYYLKLYDNFVHRYSSYARSGRRTNPYGRW